MLSVNEIAGGSPKRRAAAEDLIRMLEKYWGVETADEVEERLLAEPPQQMVDAA